MDIIEVGAPEPEVMEEGDMVEPEPVTVPPVMAVKVAVEEADVVSEFHSSTD